MSAEKQAEAMFMAATNELHAAGGHAYLQGTLMGASASRALARGMTREQWLSECAKQFDHARKVLTEAGKISRPA